MSKLEQMREQLEGYKKDLDSMRGLAKHYFEIADLENAIWVLEQRIKEFEEGIRKILSEPSIPVAELKKYLDGQLGWYQHRRTELNENLKRQGEVDCLISHIQDLLARFCKEGE